MSAIQNPDEHRARPAAADRARTNRNGNTDDTNTQNDTSTAPRTERREGIEPAKLLPEIREFDGHDERNDRREGNDANGFLREIRPTADAGDAADSANVLTDLRDLRRVQVARALSAFTAMVARMTAMTAMTSMTTATAHAAPTEEPRTVGDLRRLEIVPETSIETSQEASLESALEEKSLFPSREPAAEMPEASDSADPSNAQPRCDARVSVTVHPAEGPLYPHTDPDFLELLHATARRWERSGLWQEAVEKEIAAVRQAAETPTGARVLPRETRSRLHVRHVAWEEKDRRRLENLLGPFERRFLFIDATDPVQLAFAARLMKLDAKTTDPKSSNDDAVDDLAKLARLTGAAGTSTAVKGNGSDARPDTQRDDRKDAEHLLPLRVVLTAGSRSTAERILPGTRIWFDQGGALTRRLGLNALPAFVRLTPEAHVLFQGALTEDGFLRFDAPTDADGVERTESTSVMPVLGAQ